MFACHAARAAIVKYRPVGDLDRRHSFSCRPGGREVRVHGSARVWFLMVTLLGLQVAGGLFVGVGVVGRGGWPVSPVSRALILSKGPTHMASSNCF